MRGLEHLLSRERLRAGAVHPGEQGAQGMREPEALLSSAEGQDKRRHKLKRFKFHLHYLTHEGNPTLVQAGQAGCGVSIRGDGQDPPGHGPSPAGPAGMAWLR